MDPFAFCLLYFLSMEHFPGEFDYLHWQTPLEVHTAFICCVSPSACFFDTAESIWKKDDAMIFFHSLNYLLSNIPLVLRILNPVNKYLHVNRDIISIYSL